MSYVLSIALVMLLQITNLSVSYDVTCTGWTALWSNTIPKWNVQLLIRMLSHLLPFPHSHSIKLLCGSNHLPELFHLNDCKGLGEQISWVFFSRYVIRFHYLILVLFLNVVVLYMYVCLVWCSTTGFTIRNMAAWLSTHSDIGSWMGNPTSLLMDFSQAAYCPVLASSIF